MLDIHLVRVLAVRFFVCIIAIGHALAAYPTTHERIVLAATLGGCGILDADAAVENDIHTSATVLFYGELVLGKGAGALVRRVGAV
jgi:hypothetical protein